MVAEAQKSDVLILVRRTCFYGTLCPYSVRKLTLELFSLEELSPVGAPKLQPALLQWDAGFLLAEKR